MLRKPTGVTKHGLLQCRLDPPVDQPDRQRFVRLDPSRGEQEVLGAGRPDELDQAARLGVAIDEAELGRSDREMRVGGAKPQIAGERQAKAAADGDAADDCDRRAVEVHQRLETVLERVAIIARRRSVAIDLAKFGDVGAGAEMRALAFNERHQQVVARLDRGADRRQRAPHRAGNRIAAFRAVEDNTSERRLEAQGYLGH